MIKKLWAVCLCASLILGLAGCNTIQENKQTDSGKLQIITTLFPQYDFARQIAGDLAEVTLLLPPGTEAHTYEPSPADIIKIQKSDVFIYTGKYMERWAEGIIGGLDQTKTHVLDVSEGVSLVEEAEEPGHTEEDSAGAHAPARPTYLDVTVQRRYYGRAYPRRTVRGRPNAYTGVYPKRRGLY